MRRNCAIAAVLLAVGLGVLPAGASTHLLQPTAAEHVVLTSKILAGGSKDCQSGSFEDMALFRVFPDGSLSAGPFTWSSRYHLVITDVEWQAIGVKFPLQTGRVATLKIFLLNGPNKLPVFLSRPVPIDQTMVTARPGSSEQLTAGFAVASGTSICPVAVQEDANSIFVISLATLVLRGYLVPAG